MHPIPEYSTLAVGQLFFWSNYDPKVKYECSCSALVTSAGLIFIDPLPLAQETLTQLLSKAAVLPAAILLTNANHQRDSLQLAEKLSIPIYAPIETKKEIVATFYFEPDEKILGLQSFDLSGFGLGETAFLDEEKNILILGDAVTNAGSEGLLILPKKYCENSRLAMKSLQKLKKIAPLILLTAHGIPVTTSAAKKLQALLC
ncbi:MAG: hypothetical protein ACH346_01710 [Chthoniobacterales bacterium]